MAVKKSASKQELRSEIERLQGVISSLNQDIQNQQKTIQRYQFEQDEQFIASPTYKQMQEERKFLKSIADLTDINIVKDRERLEREKQAVQQVYADNKAMMEQPEDYFVGITECSHDTQEWLKLKRQVAEGQGAEEAYKILLSQRDEYILQLIQRLFTEPEDTDRKDHEELRAIVESFGEQVFDKERKIEVTVKLFDLYCLLREYDERKEKEDYIQKEINRIRQEYDSLKISYDKLRIATMPDITENEIVKENIRFPEHEWDRPKLVRNIKIANTKIYRQDDKIRELQRQLKEAESKRYDSYVGQDALSYSLLQEENQMQKKHIENLNGMIEGFHETIQSLRKQISTMQTVSIDEKVEMLGQTIDSEKEAKKAVRNKIGRKPTDSDSKQLIIKLAEQKKSFRGIASATNLSVATVSRVMRDYILDLHGKGQTEEQIIENTHIREKVVHKMIKEHYLSQVFLRGMGESQSDENAIEATRACQKEFESRNIGTDELRAFYDCAKDYPVLETMDEFTVVKEAKKLY